MTLIRKHIPSPNYESRNGANPRILVLHTTEGAKTIEELGNYFAQRSSRVSSHVGADDKKNTVGEFVNRRNSAWTQGKANPVSLSMELCARASWSRAEWMRHPNLLENCALWIAEEASFHRIPIVKLTPAQAQGSGRGVCQHRDLGVWGGGHHDCGDGFPMDYVLEMANGGGKEDDLGYPDWFWSWSNWYLTTNRDPNQRPDGIPATIPQWAWDALDNIKRVGTRFGMSSDEKEWITWYEHGKVGPRPDVPQTIPDRWWDDLKWITTR